MQSKYEIKLPRKFSDVIIHKGVPELGTIEDESRTTIDWMFTAEELVCVADDARNIIKGKFTKPLQLSAERALFHLDNLIGQIEARHGEIRWPV